MANDDLTKNLFELDQTLVQLFRALQELIVLSKKERIALLNSPEEILTIVEEKEALLDRVSVLDDRCRQHVQEISLGLNIHLEDTSIQSLLPHLQSEDSSRIQNLSDGIQSLAVQARELNHASQAIAVTKLDWLKATQSFLLDIFQPQPGYRSRLEIKHQETVTGLGVERRA